MKEKIKEKMRDKMREERKQRDEREREEEGEGLEVTFHLELRITKNTCALSQNNPLITYQIVFRPRFV